MSRPRIRSIKPEMWQDEAFGGLSLPARLLFIGLITMADDEGRLRNLPAAIIGHVFPYDSVTPAKLEQWLSELADAQLITRYTTSDQRSYMHLRSWHKHQKINRATPSTFPPPPSRSVNGHGELTEDSLNGVGVVH